ncbi:uncharacterized protein LOC142576437 [Dermacentor variabilis]|uniref:uncharacterized protein LOC142576437 n=1 Tax=Dermacentor variabilis TaxID=34621 RepID=UPI003F5C6EE7
MSTSTSKSARFSSRSRMKKTAVFACQYCDQRCASKRNVQRHIQNVHKIPISQQKSPKYECDECQGVFYAIGELRSHHVNEHHFQPTYEKHHFPTMAAFKSWKEKVERDTRSRFAHTTGAKKNSIGTKISYFTCHRSGSYASQAVGNRKRKRAGSIKCGKICFAAMTVAEAKTGVSVTFQRKHRGHDFDLCHVFLSKSERGALAAKLREGVPMKAILEDARANVDETFHRLNRITRQDLHSIMRDARNAERLDAKDYVSVQLWVERMHGERDNPVLFFKHQGQPDKSDILERSSEELLEDRDFMLVIMTLPQQELFSVVGADRVCVDGTHGRAAGLDLQVITVLGLDECGAGFPVAYCITNRTDQKAMCTFFAAVRSRTGPVAAKAFMTDDVPTFSNAWQEVMGQPQQHLLCAWHVDKSLRQAIKKHIRDNKRKVLAYKAVKGIMDAPDEEALEVRIKDFLHWCDLESSEEAGVLGFKEHFLHHYAERAESWAACFRKGAENKKHMHLDALHKVLKHWHAQEKADKRVDKLVSSLLKVTRDTVFDHLARFVGNAEIEFERATRARHTKGLNIEPNQIGIVAFRQWAVNSQTYDTTTYAVTLERAKCCDACRLGCAACKVCIHNVTCACADYELRRNLCKHIHAVFTGRPTNSYSPHSDEGDVDSMDMPDEPQNAAVEVEECPDVGANVEILMDLKQDVSGIPKPATKGEHCYFCSASPSDGSDISNHTTREQALRCLSDHNYCWTPYGGTQTEETNPAIGHSQAVQANFFLKARKTRTLGTQT